MRIGIDITKALGRPDGIGNYVTGLASALMEIDRQNEYLLYSPVEQHSSAEVARRFPGAAPNFAYRGSSPPGADRIDVFHVTAHRVPVGMRAPLLFTLYDLSFLTHPDCHTIGNRLLCLAGLARAAAAGARVQAISDATRQDARQLLALRDVAVVHPAAHARFRPQERAAVDAVLARHGLARPYVLSVGVLEPRKNLAGLLAGFARLPAEPAVTLAVAGPAGWLVADPRQLAVESGAGERVRLLGEVPDEDLPALYAGAELLVYPSLHEGFGLPVLEAMSCGTPVVVSRVPALAELVGEAGILVEPEPQAIADGIAALLGDPTRRAELSAAGLERAAAFSWHRAAAATLELYRGLAAGPS
jgi:glycosyltransferase involved in cell wall biosynthesis